MKKYKNKTKRMMKAMFWGEGGKADENEVSKEEKKEEKTEEKVEDKSVIRKGINTVKGFASEAYNAMFGKKN